MFKPQFKPQVRLALSLVATFAVVVMPLQSSAAACADRDAVVSRLTTDYSEQLTFGGLQKIRGGQTVMEIWASSETGTYTVLMTDAYGVSCIVAAGTDFFKAAPSDKPPDQKS